MLTVKNCAIHTSYSIPYISVSSRDIPVRSRGICRPALGRWAGDALHDFLQFDVYDKGLDPMVKAFLKNIGPIAHDHEADKKVYLPHRYNGRLDWGRFTKRCIHIIEFKWAMDGLPERPHDVDIRQVALYVYALHRAFPEMYIIAELAYFYGGHFGTRPAIRVFQFKNPRELYGIANAILERN